MRANRRWSRTDLSRLFWDLVDALLIVLLLHLVYSILQYGIHRNELRHLEGKLQSRSHQYAEARRQVHMLILDTLEYSKRDPEVLGVLGRHGIDPATFPKQLP